MRKLILVAAITGCGFAASAQNSNIGIVEAAPPPPQERAVSTEDMVFTSVEQMPEFPGGMAALMQYLATHVKYPEAAQKANIQGRVYVKFVVNRTGKVEHAELMRDIGSGCGEEALRVVRSMPDWRPGKQNGRAVSVYYTLPVSFKLSDPEPEKIAK